MDVNEFGEISELQEFQRVQELLQEITESINASENLNQMFMDTKDHILDLFKVQSVNIFAVDRSKKDIYSIGPEGNKSEKIRLPIDKKSIPGYVATTRNSVTIANVNNKEELKSIDNDLTFDASTDKKLGNQTKQVMAVPITYNIELMGVIQIINKTDPTGEFAEEEPVMLLEISEALGAAFHKHRKEEPPKKKETKFGYLISQDLITEEELEKARSEAMAKKEALEVILMKKYHISRDDIRKSLEIYYKCRFIQFNRQATIPGYLLEKLEKSHLLRNLWIPFEEVGGFTHVIVEDPHDLQKRKIIESALNSSDVKYDVALPEDIIRFINHAYEPEPDESDASEEYDSDEIQVDGEAIIKDSEEDMMQLVTESEVIDEADQEAKELESKVITESLGAARQAAIKEAFIKESDNEVIQLVNKIINEAFEKGASDIHIEPDPDAGNVGIRYRIDGTCIPHMTVPYSFRAALVSRIKIMAALDITVRRLPQDGKIKMNRPDGKAIELRVATMPTQENLEDVVMRILTAGKLIPLEAQGLTKRNYKELLKLCEKPYGIILVVGPTGSGKTTMLHAALRYINTPDRKIWTAEDPIEITQRGLRQVQVHSKIGFDFAAAMRSFLRSDPDIIMVGEMRDYETAKIAVEASLTGHLVFSTLHTNSAPETVTRLLDMGIDQFNFSDSLLGILAQRLVRTLCKKCKEAYHPTDEEYKEIVRAYGKKLFDKLNVPSAKSLNLYRPKGCDSCENSGYKGRMGIHELLINTDANKRLILKRATIETIRENGISEGMRTLLQDGISKAIIGLTDLKQVFRACIK
ncbi:MAG TPA: ATPase, T2SS/T4P/T4SS family [Syntrophales bacterium]|nr:ATPase, T2SS/T4P/T4SS family [Syntrophales bacterium]